MKKTNFVRGALVLAVGGLLCKGLGALYRVPLANILGAEGMGVYQLIYPIYAFILVFATGGVSVAEARLVALARSKGNKRQTKNIFASCFFLMFFIGLVLSLIFLLFSQKIAFSLGNTNATLGLKAISFAIFFSSLIAAIRGYFQGHENMSPTAISQICEQLFKLAFGLLFSSRFISKGIEFGVFGATLGVLIAELISLIFLVIYSLCKKKKKTVEIESTQTMHASFLQTIKEVVKTSFPIMLGAIALPFALMIDSFLVVNLLKNSGISAGVATSLFGIQSGMVNSLVNFPTILSMSLAVALVPAITFSKSKKETMSLVDKTETAFKVVFVLTLPSSVGLFLVAPQIMQAVYPALSTMEMTTAILLLRVSAINVLYISFIQVSTAVLQGVGKITIPVWNMLIACLVKIALTFLLVSIPKVNIIGSAISGVICYFIASILNIFSLKKHVVFSLKKRDIFFTIYSVIIMAIIVLSAQIILQNIESKMFVLFMLLMLAIVVYFTFILGYEVISKNKYKNKLFTKYIK